MRYNSEVKRINVTDRSGDASARFEQAVATGVTLANGEVLNADIVISNGDYAHTYLKLIEPQVSAAANRCAGQAHAPDPCRWSWFTLAFGPMASRPESAPSQHHSRPTLRRRCSPKFSIAKCWPMTSRNTCIFPRSPTPAWPRPAITPPIPWCLCPTTPAALDWRIEGDKLVDKVLRFLDERGYIPGLCERIVYKSFITPDYFEHTLNSYLGNAFGPEPVLTQMRLLSPAQQKRGHRKFVSGGRRCATRWRHSQRDDERQDDRPRHRQRLQNSRVRNFSPQSFFAS